MHRNLLNVKSVRTVSKPRLSGKIGALVVTAFLLVSATSTPVYADNAFVSVESTKGVALSPGDQALTREALGYARKGQWKEAENIIARAHDRLPAKIFSWLYYTKSVGPADFRRISGFIRKVPDWPKQGALRVAAEKSIPANLPDGDVIAWFDQYPPKTYDGLRIYLDALRRTVQTDKLRRVVGEWWRGTVITPDQQTELYRNYGRFIGAKDHLVRLEKLLDANAWSAARQIAQMVGKGYPQLVEARIALASNAANASRLADNVPPQLRSDPGLLYERLRWRRAKNFDVGAIEILHSQPDYVPNPEDWWTERAIMARRLMDNGQYKSAYLLAADHPPKDGEPAAQSQFLSGWIAFTFLHRPGDAFPHFEALYKGATTPITKSRGAYWAGRASAALGHEDVARAWYQVSAHHQTTFYGQLAIAQLDDKYRPAQHLPPQRSVEGQNRFNHMEMVQVARLLNQAGFRTETTDFLNALSDKVTTPEDYLYVAELSRDLDHLQNAVRIAKKGLQKDIMLVDSAFPTMLRNMRDVKIEWALVHGVIRQESSFDYAAMSPVGARGLMQVMPSTAQYVARKIGISANVDRLTSDPDYNIRIGSAYLGQLVDRYDGSYPLALAAYNAGPGRVDGWLKEIGDPRTGKHDIVDWVEQIPISETRNYVQRVLEAVYVYRIKLRNVQKSYNAPIHVALRGQE